MELTVLSLGLCCLVILTEDRLRLVARIKEALAAEKITECCEKDGEVSRRRGGESVIV